MYNFVTAWACQVLSPVNAYKTLWENEGDISIYKYRKRFWLQAWTLGHLPHAAQFLSSLSFWKRNETVL